MIPILPEHSHCGVLNIMTVKEYKEPGSFCFNSIRLGGLLAIFQRNKKKIENGNTVFQTWNLNFKFI